MTPTEQDNDIVDLFPAEQDKDNSNKTNKNIVKLCFMRSGGYVCEGVGGMCV